MYKPLSGYKVVELGTHVAVPIAGRMLADWGAEVIKAEPLKGEPWRTVGDSYGVTCTPEHNPLFENMNMNKQDIALDLKSKEGHKAMLELLNDADIFITNTRMSALEHLGLDYESLKEKFPKLIYGHLSGFGLKGPECQRPGYDIAAFWARGGMPIEWIRKGHPPFRPQAGFGDTITGSLLLNGILSALLGREKSGKGDFIEISLFGSALWCNSVGIISSQPKYGLSFPRGKDDYVTPYSYLYQTKDGDWFMWSLPDWDKRYKELLSALSLDSYINDPRFTSLSQVNKYVPELIDIFEERFSQMSTKEVTAVLNAGDFVYEFFKNTCDVINDTQAWANAYLEKISLKDGDTDIFPANPVHFSSFIPDTELSPDLGQNSRDIMRSLGYSDKQIDELSALGIIKE